MRLHELYEEVDGTKSTVDFLHQQQITTGYTINKDGSVDVDGDVKLTMSRMSTLTKIPVKFGKVTGNFLISGVKLATLEGCPDEVGKDFEIQAVDMVNLVGGPKKVGGQYAITSSKVLESLDGMAGDVGGKIYISWCSKLKSLKGLPDTVHGDLMLCANLSLLSLDGCSQRVEGRCSLQDTAFIKSLQGGPQYVGSTFDIVGCKKLTSLKYLPKTINGGLVLHGTGSLYKDAFIIFQAKGLTQVFASPQHASRPEKALNTINKYLKMPYGNARWIACQSELIDSNLEDYAKVRA
jgi:hypothetical protein